MDLHEEPVRKEPKVIPYLGQQGLLAFDKKDARKEKGCCGEKLVGPQPFPRLKEEPLHLGSTVLQKTFRILYNPTSGSGSCEKVFQRVKQQLQQGMITVEVIKSQSVEHFNRAVAEYQSIYKENKVHLVVIGGDGSLYMAVNQLQASRKDNETFPISFYPGGTANDLLRSLGLTPENLHIQELIKQPSYKRIDIGRIKIYEKGENYVTRYFVQHCGFGFTGRASVRAQGGCYRAFFRLKYKVAAAVEVIQTQLSRADA